jgi:hypothetical protein
MAKDQTVQAFGKTPNQINVEEAVPNGASLVCKDDHFAINLR